MAEYKKIGEMIERVNGCGCRVVFPYCGLNSIQVLFNGGFENAEYITTYPASLHLYGTAGHISISNIERIEQIASDKYIIWFGEQEEKADLLVRIGGN